MVTTKSKVAPSTTEVSPVSTTKKKPIWKDHIEGVWAFVHSFSHQRKNGEAFTTYATTFSRSYRDKYGEWKSTHFYGFDDLGKLTELATRAHAQIASLQQAEEHDAPEQEAQA